MDIFSDASSQVSLVGTRRNLQRIIVAISRRDIFDRDEHETVLLTLLHDSLKEPLFIDFQSPNCKVSFAFRDFRSQLPSDVWSGQDTWRFEAGVLKEHSVHRDLPLPANRRADVWLLAKALEIVAAEAIEAVVVVVEERVA